MNIEATRIDLELENVIKPTLGTKLFDKFEGRITLSEDLKTLMILCPTDRECKRQSQRWQERLSARLTQDYRFSHSVKVVRWLCGGSGNWIDQEI